MFTLVLINLSMNAQTFEYKETGTDYILMGVSIPQNNPNIAYAGGSKYTVDTAPGIVIKTTDGGESWETVYSGDNIQTISFATTDKGFAGGYSPLLKKTIDGGLTWQEVNIGSEVYGYMLIQFYNENKGVVLYVTEDYDMEVRTTSDGGDTWNLSSNPPMHGIIRLTYADENTLYAVGYSESVYKSTDGGDNWELIKIGGSDINMGVAFKNAEVGAYAGEDGKIFTTIDGGENWELKLNTEYHFFHGMIYKDNKILAAGTDEDVYLSTDNGETFEFAFNGPGDDSMYEAALFADNSGLICGSGGTMIKFSEVFMNTIEIEKSKASVYPVPTTDKIFVENHKTIDSIEILDLSGRLLLSQKTAQSKVEIDLHKFPKGVYFLKVNSQGQITTHKISKK